jgi:hypothetical protein
VSAVVWLGGWLALPLLGAPLLSHPAYGRFSRVCRAVLSGAAGLAVLSFVQTVSALAGVAWRPLALLLLSAGICGALRAAAGRAAAAAPEEASLDPGRRLALLLSAAGVAIALLATLAGAAGSPDLLLFWGPKAQAFAAARSIDAGFLAGPRGATLHPYYPPLVTNLYALATMAAGSLPWRAAVLTFPLLLAALALALPSALRAAERPLAPAAVSAVVVCAIGLLGAEADVAGNADTMLLLFETLGLVLLLQPRPVEGPMLLLAGVLLAGAATSKVEGLPFVLAAVFFFLLNPGARRDLPGTLFRLLGPAALSLGAWFLFGLLRHAFTRYGEYGSLLDLRWDRFGLVLAQIGRTLWRRGFGLPYLVPAALILASRESPRRLPLAVGAGLTVFLTVTYMLPVAYPELWIEWSASRTFSPLIVLLSLSVRAPEAGSYGASATPPS